MRLIRVLMLLCAACLFGVPAGCGGYAKDGDKKSESGKKKTSKNKGKKKKSSGKKTAKKSKPGGSSPADVVKKAKAAADRGDLVALMNLMEPTERKGMAAMMGIMPDMLRQMKPMLAMMGAMGGGMAGAMGGAMGGDEEEIKKTTAAAKKKMEESMAALDKLIIEMDKIKRTHKVDMPSMEEMGVSIMSGKPKPLELAKKVGTKIDNVDHGAFIADMAKAVEKMKDVMPGGGKGGPGNPIDEIKAKIGDGKLTNLKVDGDTATGTLAEEEVIFKKVDGRWYVTDVSSSGDDEDEDWDEEEDEGMEEEDEGGMGGG